MKQLIFFLFTTTLLWAQTVHFSIAANPSRFNPILATDSASSAITRWIFNGLLKYDKEGNIVPDLAKSYTFLSPTLLEFRLREDVRWSDGVPFTAKDVLFTFETILSPEVFTPYSSGFTHVESVRVVDDFTLHVTYKTPYFKALELWMMEVLPYHLLKDEEALMTSRFNQAPVGTGPYLLETFSLSKSIVLRANPDYFEGEPKPKRLVFHFLPDTATEFMMLRSHKLDVGTVTPLQYERQLDGRFHDFYAVHESIAHSYAYVGLNLEDPKFQDLRVRQALSLAIDRQELVDILLFGRGEVCTGPFLPRTNAFNPNVKAPVQDIQKAKALLAEAGYTEENPLHFTLSASSGSRAAMAEVLQHQLAKAGIQMRIRVMEWQAFLNTVILPRRFEAVLLAWNLGLKSDAYGIWHSESIRKGGFNFVGYRNEVVDRLIKEAEQTVDEERFGEIYREIFAHIAHDVPYLFLYIPHSLSAVNRAVRPVEPSLVGILHNVTAWEKIER